MYKHHQQEKRSVVIDFMKNDILAYFIKFFAGTSKLKSQWSFQKQRLLSYEELPTHLELFYDNKYIKKGYHPPPQSWKETWSLLWSIHYETINIWSHLIGSFIFLPLFLFYRYKNKKLSDYTFKNKNNH